MSLSQANTTSQILNDGISITLIEKNTSDFFLVHAEYSKSVTSNKISLKIVGRTYDFDYTSAIPALYYDINECKVSDSVETLLKGYAGSSYILLLVSLFSGKIVGLELFGILQLSYFSLA
jgi:hypothetical protein